MTYQAPPEGWLDFGTHAPLFEQPSNIELSTEVDEDGLPRWERHVDCKCFQPCRDCGAVGCRLTDGRCDGCHQEYMREWAVQKCVDGDPCHYRSDECTLGGCLRAPDQGNP